MCFWYLWILSICIARSHQNSNINCLRNNSGVLEVGIEAFNQQYDEWHVTPDDVTKTLTLLSTRFKQVYKPTFTFLETMKVIGNGISVYGNTSTKISPLFLSLYAGNKTDDFNQKFIKYIKIHLAIREINSAYTRPVIGGIFLQFIADDYEKQLKAVNLIFGQKGQTPLQVGHVHRACLKEFKRIHAVGLRYFRRLDFLLCIITVPIMQSPEESAEEVINICDNMRDIASSLNLTAEVKCIAAYYSQGTDDLGKFYSVEEYQRFWCWIVEELVRNQSHAGIIMQLAFDRTPNFFGVTERDVSKPHYHSGWWRRRISNGTIEFVEKVEELPGGSENGSCKEDCNSQPQIITPAVTSNPVTPHAIAFFSISTLAGILLISAIGFRIYRKIKANKTLTPQEVKQFFEGSISSQKGLDASHLESPEKVDDIPYDAQLEVPSSAFKIYKEEILGSGSFAIVFKGRVEDENVAVKTTLPGVDKVYLKALMQELKFLSFLGQHQHIVHLKGAHTSQITSGKLYLFLELCPMGNLLNYLQRHRDHFTNDQSVQNVNQSCDQQMLTSKILLQWSIQIANAMIHLSAKKIIHGDIAARNVLVFSPDQVKLTDFGLSRRLYAYSNYVKKKKEPFPWRHMSIEALRDWNVSLHSDVWAYGVMMWEAFSLGEVPYPGLNWSGDFLQLLIDGLRPVIPKHADPQVYAVMTSCWTEDVESRPSIALVHSKLTNILERLFDNPLYVCA